MQKFSISTVNNVDVISVKDKIHIKDSYTLLFEVLTDPSWTRMPDVQCATWNIMRTIACAFCALILNKIIRI